MIPILHLITTLDVGGAETALLRLVSRLDRSRFSCTVVSLAGPGALSPAFEGAGIRTITLCDRRSVGARTIWQLTKVIRRARPALLQTWLYHADLLGLLAGRIAGVPAIAWNVRCSDLPAAHPSRSLPWIRALLARLSRAPQAVVVNSEAGRQVHERLGYRPRRWELIPNGFDTDTFSPSREHREAVRRELGIHPDAPTVGLIARYHPMKDHRTFLAAMKCVAAAHPALRIVLAGRGVDERNEVLAGMIKEQQLDGRIALLGEVANPARLLAALDVTVSSSAYGEGFPNIVAESMACGVAVAATAVGDSARILADLGTAVTPRDPHALAGAVNRVLALPRAERVALGLAGRKRIVEHFSIESIVRRYEDLYVDLTSCVERRR